MWPSILEVIGVYILCIIATERVTEVVVHGDVFAWLRNLPCKRQFTSPSTFKEPKPRKMCVFFCKLFTCGYCFSHWSALLFASFLPGGYFELYPLDNLLVKWFALLGISNMYHNVFTLVFRGRVRAFELVGPITLQYETEPVEEE